LESNDGRGVASTLATVWGIEQLTEAAGGLRRRREPFPIGNHAPPEFIRGARDQQCPILLASNWLYNGAAAKGTRLPRGRCARGSRLGSGVCVAAARGPENHCTELRLPKCH